ncbi:tyrosine-type recombinase/integrase [Rhodococcus sp. IEGM 1318]|uniref:tyrosine-type recombinase/integrase n=1 Tax=Rhodococcus sp. IEGM 1318 TaxID=3082226 RepID=UPI002954A3C5|nr:tyrosine-type recombinase/integrase [Rhodococcus sp. IEGM 1318]MDV8008632.1 tyrosine-type recombinase/integrase [Rhodococcus sp. IEGM 1318]
MAHVQKRTTGSGETRYVVKYRTPDGKGRSKGGFTTKKAAEDYATEVDFNQNRGTTFDAKAGGVTFRSVAGDWLASRMDLKPRTRQGYAYILNTGADLDATFGGYPLKKITRPLIVSWIARRVSEGKRPSTIKHQYFILKQVLDQAVADGRLSANPCDHVTLPTDRTAVVAVVDAAKSGNKVTDGVVDPEQFLTADQAAALAAATPWPYNVMVHVAAWTGLRAAELAGLQVGDVKLPQPHNHTAPGAVHVARTVLVKYGPLGNPESKATPGKPEIVYDTPKTRGSRRKVPLTPATVAVLRDYLLMHPRADEPFAPLFPASALKLQKPSGKRAPTHESGPRKGNRMTPAEQSARQPLADAEARLLLDWESPVVHRNFYGQVYRPAVHRANLAGAGLPDDFRFHSLRHTYASLCIAAGIQPFVLSKFMGHANTNVTLGVYAHLFQDDHADAMTALGALGQPPQTDNVVPIRAV